MAISHAGHNHPATPAARAACRKSMTTIPPMSNTGVNALYNDFIDRPRKRQIMSVRTGKLIDIPAPKRIQPRRGSARVAARNTTCVQAALHVDAHGGRCACGWVAQVAS